MSVAAALELLCCGDAVGALALLDNAGSPDETDTATLVARGMVQLANDRPSEALTALRTAVARGDTAPTTLLNLALAEQKSGDLTCALCRMEELERRIPDWDEPPLRIAEALRAGDRHADAEAAYSRVLEISPHNQSALLGLAGLLILRGAGSSARVLRSAAAASPRIGPRHGTFWVLHWCATTRSRWQNQRSPRRCALHQITCSMHCTELTPHSPPARKKGCWPGSKSPARRTR
jgi:tetratricopeptide (TPR) repeat protein